MSAPILNTINIIFNKRGMNSKKSLHLHISQNVSKQKITLNKLDEITEIKSDASIGLMILSTPPQAHINKD